jgi:hypothetical protein
LSFFTLRDLKKKKKIYPDHHQHRIVSFISYFSLQQFYFSVLVVRISLTKKKKKNSSIKIMSSFSLESVAAFPASIAALFVNNGQSASRFAIICGCVGLFQEGTPLMRDVAITVIAGGAIKTVYGAVKELRR